jgi:hypothetical protein
MSDWTGLSSALGLSLRPNLTNQAKSEWNEGRQVEKERKAELMVLEALRLRISVSK